MITLVEEAKGTILLRDGQAFARGCHENTVTWAKSIWGRWSGANPYGVAAGAAQKGAMRTTQPRPEEVHPSERVM